MSTSLNISGITGGVPPYTFYVCDEYGNNCSVLGTTGGTYVLNSFYSTANTLMIKVIDSVSCEFFTLITCPEDLCIILTELGEDMRTEDGFNLVYC